MDHKKGRQDVGITPLTFIGSVLVELERATDHRRMLLNADSEAVGLEWGWRFCMVESLPGDADPARPLPTLCGGS